MKIKTSNDLLIIYLYNMKLNLENKVELTKDIKSLLVLIIRYYQINLSGIYDVIIYENKYYGYILEINRIKEFEYSDFIDLKLDIKYNQSFYLVVDNYNFLENIKNVFYKNSMYFVNLCDLENVNIVFEYGDIIYKDCSDLINESVKIS